MRGEAKLEVQILFYNTNLQSEEVTFSYKISSWEECINTVMMSHSLRSAVVKKCRGITYGGPWRTRYLLFKFNFIAR